MRRRAVAIVGLLGALVGPGCSRAANAPRAAPAATLAVLTRMDFTPQPLGAGWQVVLANDAQHWVALEHDGMTFHVDKEAATGRCYSLRVVSSGSVAGIRYFPDDASLRALPPPADPDVPEPSGTDRLERPSCNAESNPAADHVDVVASGTDFDSTFAFGVVEDGWSLVGVRGDDGITGVTAGSRFTLQLPAGRTNIGRWLVRDPGGRVWACASQQGEAAVDFIGYCTTFTLDPTWSLRKG